MMMMTIGAGTRVTLYMDLLYCTNGNLRNETRRSQIYIMYFSDVTLTMLS